MRIIIFLVSFSLPVLAGNVILMIADGLSSAAVTIARHEKKSPLTLDTASNIALIKTLSADKYVTDSAAAITAMATGKKTNNGLLGLDPGQQELKLISELAKENDKQVGVVTTCEVTDATPAGLYAHVSNRHEYRQIIKQLFSSKLDLVLGGGYDKIAPLKYSYPHNFSVYDSFFDLTKQKLPQNRQILGLFAPVNLEYARLWEKNLKMPTLPMMAEFAVKQMIKTSKDFLLIIEGGRIEQAAHANDLKNHIGEILDFDLALSRVLNIIQNESSRIKDNTLVIALSDHDCAGISLNGYSDIGSPLVDQIIHKKGIKDLTDQANPVIDGYHAITYATGPQTAISLNIATHSGTDVPAYAWGYQSHLVKGTIDNTEIFNLLKHILELRD